jgi:hypothetical protein
MFNPPAVIEPVLENLRNSLYPLGDSTYILEKIVSPLSSKSEYARVIDFLNDRVFPSSYMGSIAIEHKRLLSPPQSDEAPDPVDLYDTAMRHVLAIQAPPEVGKRPDAVFITPEDMIIWTGCGQIFLIDQRGHIIAKSKLFESTTENSFQFAAFFETGYFLGTTAGDIYLCEDFSTLEGHKITTLPRRTYKLATAVSAFQPADPDLLGHGPALYVAYENEQSDTLIQIQSIDEEEPTIREITFPYTLGGVEFSPNRELAIVWSDRAIYLYGANFQEVMTKICLPGDILSFGWCGSSSILVRTEEGLKLVGMTPRGLSIAVDGPCFVLPEVDGARIVTRTAVYRLRDISGALLDLIRQNRENPGVQILYELSSQAALVSGDALAEVGGTLILAIPELLQAAKFVTEFSVARYLLDVIVHIRHRVLGFDSKGFSDAIVLRRIIEGLARAPFSQPMTVAELQALGYERLVMRLCNRYQHVLAYHVADYINTRYDPIFNHWAHSLILSHAPADAVIEKLQQCGDSLDFTKLAAAAKDLGTRSEAENIALATKILKLNPVKGRNVPLRIEWRQWDEAIQDAIDSNDVSLLLHTLNVVRAQPDLRPKLQGILIKNPVALQTWAKMALADPSIEEGGLSVNELMVKAGLTKEIFARNLVALVRAPAPDAALLQAAKMSFGPVKKSFGPVMDRIAAISAAAEKLQLPPTASPYQIVEAAIERDLPDAATIASSLQLSSDEVLFRKLDVSTRVQNPLKSKLIRDFVKGAGTQNLILGAMRYHELKKTNMISLLLQAVNEEEVKNQITDALDKARVRWQ